MDSRSFYSVANETYPLARLPQSSPPKKTLLAGVMLLVGDMQVSTHIHAEHEAAMREWARIRDVRAPESATGVVLNGAV
jgi:hypothetical protein